MWARALAAQVTAAEGADAPPTPALPPVPTVAVQVSVSAPGVSINVQAGTVNVSVSTASVDVSVAVSTEGAVPGTVASASGEQQHATQSDGASGAQVEQVVPADTSAKKGRPPRAAPPKRLAPPPIRAATTTAGIRPIRSPRVDRATRVPAATKVSGRASEPRTTRPKAPRRCCKNAQASTAIAAAPIRLGARPKPDPWRGRYELAGIAPATLPEAVVWDNRLLLQLGVLAAFLYLVCLAGWFAARRSGGGGPEPRTRR